MKKRVFLSIAFAIAALIFGIVPGSNLTAQTRESVETKTISLGLVSETNQKEIEGHFREFVSYVARKLSAEVDGRIVIAPTPAELARLLEQKKVDFYMESPYPTYVINNVHGAGTLLLRRWKGGMAEYRSLIFTKRNSEIRRLEHLRGKIIAFEDPGSTSGHLLPKFFLQRNGFKLSDKSRGEVNVLPGEIGYVFAYSQDKLVDLVLSKQAAAGAFSNDDYTALDEKRKSDITVVAQTETLPRHLLSVRRDLASPLAKRLEEILLSMDEDDEGRRILQKTDGTTKFDALPGGEAGIRRRLLESFYSPEKK